MDFTHKRYQELVAALRREGYRFLLFRELEHAPDHDPGNPCVILRHDVDRLPQRSLALAKVERDAGVRSTFFFRTKPVSFSHEIMRQIKEMGHEIGFHYESLSDASGDMELAWEYFRNDLEKFRPLGGVVSIAMHGRPLSPWDNRTLWEHFDYREAGIECEAYLDIDWGRFLYFTDTGRCWNSKNNIRDHVEKNGKGGRAITAKIASTKDLVKFVPEKFDMVISTHPERWTGSFAGWLQVLATDSAINMAKQVIRHLPLSRPKPGDDRSNSK